MARGDGMTDALQHHAPNYIDLDPANAPRRLTGLTRGMTLLLWTPYHGALFDASSLVRHARGLGNARYKYCPVGTIFHNHAD